MGGQVQPDVNGTTAAVDHIAGTPTSNATMLLRSFTGEISSFRFC